MKTTINKILAHSPSVATVQAFTDALGTEFPDDKEFNLADLAARRKFPLTDVLWLLGQEGKSDLAVEFAIFCAVTMQIPEPHLADLEYETIALYNPKFGSHTLRSMANGMKNVNPVYGRSGGEENSPVWRKRRAVQQAMLARASTSPEHAAHYAAHAFTWSYQVSARGLEEKLLEMLLEEE